MKASHFLKMTMIAAALVTTACTNDGPAADNVEETNEHVQTDTSNLNETSQTGISGDRAINSDANEGLPSSMSGGGTTPTGSSNADVTSGNSQGAGPGSSGTTGLIDTTKDTEYDSTRETGTTSGTTQAAPKPSPTPHH